MVWRFATHDQLTNCSFNRNLTLFNPTLSTGLSIPYPSISLHAIQRLPDPSATDTSSAEALIQGLYMQLDLSDPNTFSSSNDTSEDDDPTVELTLLTTPSSSSETPAQAIQAMFDAVSNCSNLHPDPTFDDDEEMQDAGGDSRIVFEGSVGYEGISGLPGVQQGSGDGGLPPPFPGSGGWITAENVGEYFDEEGNWIKDGEEGGEGEGEGEGLGEGAGRVRTREEMNGGGEGEGVNGHAEEGDESKKPRTE